MQTVVFSDVRAGIDLLEFNGFRLEHWERSSGGFDRHQSNCPDKSGSVQSAVSPNRLLQVVLSSVLKG